MEKSQLLLNLSLGALVISSLVVWAVIVRPVTWRAAMICFGVAAVSCATLSFYSLMANNEIAAYSYLLLSFALSNFGISMQKIGKGSTQKANSGFVQKQ